MRILLFNWRDLAHPWAGGAEVFLYQVARRWVQQGHQVTWFCGRHESQPAQEWIEGIEIIRQGGRYSVYLHAALCYLFRFRGRYDVLFDSANGIPFFTPLFSATPKVLLVHHIHREVFFHEMPRPLAHLGNALERVGMPLLYRHAPVITVSESSRQALLGLGVKEEQISIVYNGLDHDHYRPGPKSARPSMVFIGRLRYYKRVDVAIRAMPDLLAAVPDLCFTIAGSGEAEPALRALAEELGVAERVRFLGRVSEEVKVNLLQQAHVAVSMSLKEGWGLTVLEANACGTPVVAANVPGLCDSVQDGQTGVLVPYGDARALAQAVQELLLNRDRREQLAGQALEWAAGFDWDQSAERCLEVLARCRAGEERRWLRTIRSSR